MYRERSDPAEVGFVILHAPAWACRVFEHVLKGVRTRARRFVLLCHEQQRGLFPGTPPGTTRFI
ncbi:hypothetical protein HMPREF0293_0234 [Corynebacterium glucuronolyticum ATCC 51866]|uniref:Uncharacterized protein n=1 Tax=Corynebacterium glucuronolyticum ATCC 51866 TaxID=548478 RepID=A0ABM9XSJ5_9CORY|nr:hypothetical protein HMPREF0293_0234 [Corynebacterium glucuronolyticum ATCC 51866]